MGKSITPTAQAKLDREKSSKNPVKTWATMTDEEKAAIKAELESPERQAAITRAKARAELAARGKRSH